MPLDHLIIHCLSRTYETLCAYTGISVSRDFGVLQVPICVAGCAGLLSAGLVWCGAASLYPQDNLCTWSKCGGKLEGKWREYGFWYAVASLKNIHGSFLVKLVKCNMYHIPANYFDAKTFEDRPNLKISLKQNCGSNLVYKQDAR